MSGECDACGEHCLECRCINDAQSIARVQWFFNHMQANKRDAEEWLHDANSRGNIDTLDAIDKQCAESRIRVLDDLIEEYFLAFETMLYNRDV